MLVYLEVPAETLVERLRGIEGRPMIAGDGGAPLDDVQLRERVTTLLRSRERAYRQADVIVDAGSRPPEASVSAILLALRSRRSPPEHTVRFHTPEPLQLLASQSVNR